MSLLDNPIWRSLTTTHAQFAETCNAARKFVREVSMLAGFPEPAVENYNSLAAMMREGERVGLFLQQPADPPAAWVVARSVPLLQMVCENRCATPTAIRAEHPDFIRLRKADVPEMLALTKLTNPGPFAVRTLELGDYFGIRVAGTLAAMAGERLRLPGYTEISAVCTHPDHLGHGYASVLMSNLMERIHSRGERPILHVLPENARAIQVYERLGFAKRTTLQLVVLRYEAEQNRSA
jgi:ribosomal protein S18 acetylase RimI-like enzyme